MSAGDGRPDAPPGPAQQTRDEAYPIFSALRHHIDPDSVIYAYTFQGQHPFRITHLEKSGHNGPTWIYVGDAILPSGSSLKVAVKLTFHTIDQGERSKYIKWREVEYDLWTCLISPFMKNGDMFQYLTRRPDSDCRPLILQVADAVEHLHVYASIVHGDLKCENVLISDSGDALLTDFNLSTFTTAADIPTSTAICDMSSIRFAAPEMLSGDTGRRSKTVQTDIYAFAMMILQAFTRRSPWGNMWNVALIARVCQRQIPNRPHRDETVQEFSDNWWDVCVDCWSFDPQSRPTIQEVCRRLSAYSDALEEFDALF